MANSAANSAAKAQQKAINKATVNSYAGLGLRQIQEQDAAATEAFDVSIQEREAQGTAVVSAGETGTEGVSFSNLLTDYAMRGGRARSRIEKNSEMAVQAVQQQKETAQLQGAAQMAAIPRPSKLNLFADVGLQIAKGGLGIYNGMQK
jgi:hypothetical protein